MSAAREADSEEGYEFRFIEVGEPSQAPAGDSRSLIRAHVMRDFHGKRRGGKRRSSQAEPTSSASRKQGESQQIHRFKVGPEGLRELTKKRKKRDNFPVKLPPITIFDDPQHALGDTEATHSQMMTLSGQSKSEFKHQSFGKADAEVSKAVVIGGVSVIGSDIGQSGVLDPFDTLPLPYSPRTKILLYHADRCIFSSPWMGHLRKEWLALATQDSALFHIALSHYAGNYGLKHQECDPDEALRFRMKSMRVVNDRLEYRNDVLTDGTIGTVAALSSYEATNGHLPAVGAHINGLKNMIAIRGGLHNTGMNEYTKRLVLWADLNCANALASDPLFSSRDSDKNDSMPGCHENSQDPISSERRHQNEMVIPSLATLNKDLTNSFAALRRLSTSYPCDQYVDKSVHIQSSDEVYLIESGLLKLSNLSGPRSIIRCCCIAGIIFIDNHIRGIDFIARIMGRFVERLQLSVGLMLNDVPLRDVSTSTCRAMLWILCVGAIAAAQRPGRIYFISILGGICDILDMSCWEAAEDILMNFLWPSAWDAENARLWSDIVEARSSLKLAQPTNNPSLESR